MISWLDFYHVMTAVVPLYVAMLLAYSSVKHWRIFSAEQCSGINRFVALFAVPLLSFHFISTNNPFAMNLRFLAADTLQKLLVLGCLALWPAVSSSSCSLDWCITSFSLSTLPNTLVMGIPLLKGMYGDFSGSLMVQIVVLQCIIWYTLMLFMFEYRAARLLIADQFPANAGSIASITVDPDVVSLDGRREPLEAEAQLRGDGRVHVTVRRSSVATPRPSNLTNAEIYSLQSSRNPTPRGSSFNRAELGRSSNFGPRASNFDEGAAPGRGRKDLHMFVWSSTASPASDVFAGGQDYGFSAPGAVALPHSPSKGEGRKEEVLERGDFSFGNRGVNGEDKLQDGGLKVSAAALPAMPPTSVMTRLILIMVWRKLIRNPNTYSSLIGIIWALVCYRWNFEMPVIVIKSIAILSDAGLGMAMFSLGLFMALQPRIIACGNKVAVFAMAVRFFVGPAIMALASIAVGLRGVLLRVAIVQAALPQGIVPFVFAKEYGVHPSVLSTAVIFGMLIALPITLVYYILLGL